MEKGRAKSFSILMFPWLAHGHIFPFLELAKTLTKRNNFTIYFCSTPINLDSVKTNIAKHPSLLEEDSIKLVELEIESPQLPPQLHTTKNLPPHLFPLLIKDFENSKSSFYHIFDSLKPDLLIFDVFNPWAAKHALSQFHGSPSVLFMASGATICSFHYHAYMNKTGSPIPPYEGIDFTEIRRHISPNTKGVDFGGFIMGSLNLSSEILLLKTSKELEEKYIDYLSFSCKKQIVPTGLLVVHSSDEKDDPEIMQWLDQKNENSTVFISFGSECFLSKEHINEVAKGLELCNANFIWIIRFPQGHTLSVENALPPGFLERVKGRGIVVYKFVQQTRILAHKSIGGFVSHCGWSSIMESIHYSVPIIAMPMNFEQLVNGIVVVEVGVGVEVEKDENGQYLGVEVAKALDKVFADGEGMRCRASNLCETIKKNEEQEVDEVAEQLAMLCSRKKNKLQQV